MQTAAGSAPGAIIIGVINVGSRAFKDPKTGLSLAGIVAVSRSKGRYGGGGGSLHSKPSTILVQIQKKGLC